MVEIGGQPILWHIMNAYSAGGHHEFIIALGYKGEAIKNFFSHHTHPSQWKIDLVETGLDTGTGGRLKHLAPLIGKNTFLMTYGDGVSNVDLTKLISFHQQHKKLATVTAVRPPARFGRLELNGDQVTSFIEKPQMSEGWINGGFFVLEPKALDYINDDHVMFEKAPLEKLARDNELVAFRHNDFWQCVDTIRDLRLLNDMWQRNETPWKTWKD